MHAMPLMLIVLACLAIAYRFYSAFLAAKVAALDDSRATPAHALQRRPELPSHAQVGAVRPSLRRHLRRRAADRAGAGDSVRLPAGTGVDRRRRVPGRGRARHAGAGRPVRRNGRSLAEIARAEIGSLAGGTASITILFVVIIALSGLGVVVVKALGGEEIKLAAGTRVRAARRGAEVELWQRRRARLRHAAGQARASPTPTARRRRPQRVVHRRQPRGRRSRIRRRLAAGARRSARDRRCPAACTQAVPGSSWGTFTIACTVPIALFVGLYMYKIRKGRVVEASAIGAAAVLAATVAGNWIPGSALEPYFQLSRNQTIRGHLRLRLHRLGAAGVAAAVPARLSVELSEDRHRRAAGRRGDRGQSRAARRRRSTSILPPAAGPYFNGAIFPFCFICIMCGAISGFHALVSSGTTPKMISKESDIRTIGYGAMLIEGLVGIVALIAAASLPQGDYWAINIDLSQGLATTPTRSTEMGADTDNLAEIEQQVGGESLRGRTGGAVTLAVGMAQIFRDAMHRVAGDAVNLESVIKYWYHFAIMFEALFILTTIDTGTRIARFLLQEALGKIYPAVRPHRLAARRGAVDGGW